MCFYDQHRFTCGDYKWGHFRQHCNKEYRIGETCGIKLVHDTLPLHQKCKICDKIDVKERRRDTEYERVRRWKAEGGRNKASISNAMDTIKGLEKEIYDLRGEINRRKKTC